MDVWTPLEKLTRTCSHTENPPTGYSWMAQQLPSGSTSASGLASALLKLTQQCSSNSRPPGYWAVRSARRIKISIVGKTRTQILSSHEVMDSKTWNICHKESLEHLLSIATNHPTTHARSHSLIQKPELEEYLKMAFYNRNIFVIL